MVTVWRSAAGLIHCSFLNPGKKHCIWAVCSANRWDAPKTAMPAASIGLQKGSNSSPWQLLMVCHTTNASKVEWICLRSFASSAIFIWPLANHLPLLQASRQLFAGKMLSQPARGRKCFLEFFKTRSLDFYTIGIHKLFSCWQKCVDCNNSCFD